MASISGIAVDSVRRECEALSTRFRPTMASAARPCLLSPTIERECSTGANPFKRREELIDEPLGIAAQVAQDARLGDQDGVDCQAQLGGNGLWPTPRR